MQQAWLSTDFVKFFEKIAKRRFRVHTSQNGGRI